MARHTFFSFHYNNDVLRAHVVRNAWVTQDRVDAGWVHDKKVMKLLTIGGLWLGERR